MLFQSQFAIAQFSKIAGTWKLEDKKVYKHWDITEDGKMSGISYSKDNDDAFTEVKAYLAFVQKGKKGVYQATIPRQNNGKTISFIQTLNSDSLFVFENPKHDFPKKITYKLMTWNRLNVEVSGNGKSIIQNYNWVGPTVSIDSAEGNPKYDALLAQKLQADDYGMKTYWFVILKTGSNKSSDKDFIAEKFKGHMQNMEKMVADKKLVIAGPFFKNEKEFRGIFILNDKQNTKEEIEKELGSDPAISAGLLAVEIFKWYGSAALSEYLETSDKIWKTKP